MAVSITSLALKTVAH